jgi:hypothetical protein
LEAIMGRGADAQLRGVQRFPLSAGPQDKPDRIGTAAIRDAVASAAEAVRIVMDGQYGLQDRPQRI